MKKKLILLIITYIDLKIIKKNNLIFNIPQGFFLICISFALSSSFSHSVKYSENFNQRKTITFIPSSRLGLFMTKEELEVWKERAIKGPYKVKDDVCKNSPGDWTRIVNNANAFLVSPTKERWKGDPASGCVSKGSEEPLTEGVKLRDAAFVYLIKNDIRYLDAVKKELLSQVSEPLTDFSNKKRWCDNVFHDINPSFIICEWLTRLLLAYDYTKNNFSIEERKKLDKWFKDAAYFFKKSVEDDLDIYFTDRRSGNYTFSGYSKAAKIDQTKSISHEGGWRIPELAKCYNNRRGTIMRYVGLTGIFLKDSTLQNSAKLFVKEWLKFSVFPDGVVGEFERWKDNFPDLGWSYATSIISTSLEIADAFARNGDLELYQYTTTEGCAGTQGKPKTLLLALKNSLYYLDGSVTRYVPVSKATINSDRKIDGIVKEKNWYAVNFIWYAQSNLYYKDDYIKKMYLCPSFYQKGYPAPEKLASAGPHQPWSGGGAIFPGTLFMFGQLDGKVWPY